MKKIIRLTEEDLHNIVKESVDIILNERIKGELGMTDDEVMRRRNDNFRKDADYVPNKLHDYYFPFTPNYTDREEMEAPYHTPEEMELKVARDRRHVHNLTQSSHQWPLKRTLLKGRLK